MSEAADGQPAVDAPIVDASIGTDTAAAAPETNDDIDTEAFDRVEAPDDDDAGAGDGQPDGDTDQDAKPATAEQFEFEGDDGTKYKLPKALEAALLRDKDYRQKTMGVAEQRRALETRESDLASLEAKTTESLKTFRTEHITVATKEAELGDIEKGLAYYAQFSPAAWEATRLDNPAAYKQHADQLEHLRLMRTVTTEALTAAKTDLTAKEASHAERQTAAETAKLTDNWTQANDTLAKDIPDWTPPWQPGKGQEIAQFVNKEFGITAEQIRTSTDPTAWKMANALMEARAKIATLETNAKQRTATTAALKTQAVTPAAKSAGGGAKPTGVNDQLSDDEWLRRRNAQVARRGR